MKRITGKFLGELGEEIAEKFLNSQNYLILKKNFYSRYGEIDLVALAPGGQILAFVEVKTRANKIFGEPEESVNKLKLNKIRKTIFHYLQAHSADKINRLRTIDWRIEIIAIELDGNYNFRQINHLKNFDYG